MSPPRIGLATSAAYPALPSEEGALIHALQALGLDPAPVIWDDPGARWELFSAVVVRSCWDYHLHLDRFLNWIAGLERRGVALFNPPAVLRWNARKRYLGDLAARGLAVVPTHWAAGPGAPPLIETLREAGWTTAVVKPIVSASSHETWLTTLATAPLHEARYRDLVRSSGAMVQPFIEEIVRAGGGEWSFCFFGGRFSHAALKQPQPGDFRVQPEFGGRVVPVTPDPDLVRQAATLAEAAPAPCLYARVDGYVRDGALHLMELEVLEPSMLLDCDAAAAERFAAAIAAAV